MNSLISTEDLIFKIGAAIFLLSVAGAIIYIVWDSLRKGKRKVNDKKTKTRPEE
jgi:hypothetical protein